MAVTNSQNPPPVKPAAGLGLAIIGTGRVASSHASATLAVEGVTLRAVADIDGDRLAQFREKHRAPAGEDAAHVEGYADYHAMLERDDVDLVVVALPHWLHAEATIHAIEAGKHVLVEKPMAMTLEECDRMIDTARRNDRRLAIGLTHHFHAIPAQAKHLLDSGRFGRIAWGTEVMYAPRRFGSNPDWFFDRSRGGGQLLANGVHFADRLLWTIGSTDGGAESVQPAAPDRAKPVAVKAIVGTFFNHYPADDGAVVFIQFDTGQVATMHLTGHYAGASRSEAEYVCARGMVKYARELLATNPENPDDNHYHPVPVPGNPRGGFVGQLANVAGAIRHGTAPAVPGEWGRLVMSVLFAAEESSRTGREVRFDP